MNKISVEGIKGYGYHGCMDEEARIGQHYVVDVHMKTDFLEAAEEDDLSKTVDYVEVNKVVKEELAHRSKLIETVSLRLAPRTLSIDNVQAVEVKVCKPAPPINGDVDRVCTIVTL